LDPDHSQNTICLLDDDPSVLKATGRLLTAAGWNTRSFNDPQAFLEYAESHQPRLAIIDIMMPVMNGLEVQARLSPLSKPTRVIVLTSYDEPAVRAKALNAGASAFFLKPVNDEEFLAAVESALQEKAPK